MTTTSSHLPPDAHHRQLCSLVQGNPAFLSMLRILRDASLPMGHVAGGTLRSMVWDALHGQSRWQVPRDIDVVYFDPDDLSEGAEEVFRSRLLGAAPALPWEVVNQARVHLWAQKKGVAVRPFRSMHEAVASWLERTHCVAMRLTEADQIEIIAPLGLEDLLSVVVRRNPSRSDVDTYRHRCEIKHYEERWPTVTVVSE
jgi:hypothetical protein